MTLLVFPGHRTSSAWNTQGKLRAGSGLIDDRQASIMGLCDGATHGQTYPHTIGLGGEERVKYSIDIRNAASRVSNSNGNGITF